MMEGVIGQQNSCKTLLIIGVHSTMHLMHPSYGLTTFTYIHTYVVNVDLLSSRNSLSFS